MNFLSGIVTGVKTIFGSNSDGTNNVMTVAKGIGGFIDEQQFTPEERAKHMADILPAMQTFMDNTAAENTQRSITRREIAIWVIRNWVIMLWISIVAFGVEVAINSTQHEFSAFVLNIVMLSTVEYLVLGVGAFFFGAHIIRTGMAGMKERK